MGRKSNFRQANKEQCGNCPLFNKGVEDCDSGLVPLTPRCTEEKDEALRARIKKLQEIANQ